MSEKLKKTVWALNILGPEGDDLQEFKVGTNDYKTVSVQVGTVLLNDDGTGKLRLNGGELYISDIINQIAADVLAASKEYTNESISTISSFDILIVEELPTVGKKGCIYFVPNTSGGYSEWIYSDSKWNKVGDTNFDLSDYYTSKQVDELFFKKEGGTISGDVYIEGDLTTKTIKYGDATIVLSLDGTTGKTNINITGGTIYLSGDIKVSGNIYQKDGDIIQYETESELK